MRFSARLRSGSDAVERLFARTGHEFAQLQAHAARGEGLPSFELTPQIAVRSTNSWRRFTSSNVMGMIRGSDANTAGECLLVTAHLDHLGTDPKAPGRDKIFNGALDNASGVATMIEVARGVAASKPRRTVVFVATTGEEIGLVGSDYLAAHQISVCNKVVGVVNLDGGVPLHNLPKASAYGGWHSTIGPAFDKAAAANGIGSIPDDPPPAEFFNRTDHYSFAIRGIPAVYLVMDSGEKDQDGSSYRGRYHQPNDDLSLPFNWSAGARFARLAYDLVQDLANARQTPLWYEDSPFAHRYAKDQVKARRP
jgi:Zn-dependent M28 family amino/carboxypeptidase